MGDKLEKESRFGFSSFFRSHGPSWRFPVACVFSILAHLSIYIFNSPDYNPVSDIAVEMEIVEGAMDQELAPEAQGPRVPEPEPVPEIEPDVVPEPPAEPPVEVASLDSGDAGVSADTEVPDTEKDSEKDTEKDSEKLAANTLDAGVEDLLDTDVDAGIKELAASSDAGVDAGGDAGVDGGKEALAAALDGGVGTDADGGTGVASSKGDGDVGTGGEEEGICLHDVFAYANPNPSWMLWLSMKAFNGSRYEQGLASILSSFYLYEKMVSATEIDPLTELEGMLISADRYQDFNSYEIVATYNFKEEQLKERLKKNVGNKPGFQLQESPGGYSGILPGEYRWDMVGNGRVMIANRADRKVPMKSWSNKVTCMAPRKKITAGYATLFNQVVRSHIGAAKGKRWPIMVLATRDPSAVGLYGKKNAKLASIFEWAIVKGYFSDPIRIEGIAHFAKTATPEDMKKVDRVVQYILKEKTQGIVMGVMGITEMAKGVKIQYVGNELRFVVPLKEGHVHAGLKFLEMQSQVLNQAIAPSAPATPK